MVRIENAILGDVERLTEIQTCTFEDDNKRKPPGCSLEGTKKSRAPSGVDLVKIGVSISINPSFVKKSLIN